MTLSQLEYLITVSQVGHFGLAAQQLHVTQPTLSMMIKKLEDELGFVLLDRSKKPIVPTQLGSLVIEQAKRVLLESQRIETLVKEFTQEIQGPYTLGLIPTVAPYIVPSLVSLWITQYPNSELSIFEAKTEELIQQLESGNIDAAILSTPIDNPELVEYPLFYEEFFVFGTFEKTGEYLLPSDIDPNQLWLLETGHCLRSQIVNLCELKKIDSDQIHYNSGSLETLIEIVRKNQGITILPELTTKKLTKKEQKHLGRFKSPAPFREMSLVSQKHLPKQSFVQLILDIIEEIIPLSMRKRKKDSRLLEIY